MPIPIPELLTVLPDDDFDGVMLRRVKNVAIALQLNLKIARGSL